MTVVWKEGMGISRSEFQVLGFPCSDQTRELGPRDGSILSERQTQAPNPGLPAFNPGLSDGSTVSAYTPYGAILSARL